MLCHAMHGYQWEWVRVWIPMHTESFKWTEHTLCKNNKRNKNNRIIWMQILCINTDLEIPNWNMPCIWIRFSSENRNSLQIEPSRNVLWNPIQPCFDLLLCFWNYFDLKSDKFLSKIPFPFYSVVYGIAIKGFCRIYTMLLREFDTFTY